MTSMTHHGQAIRIARVAHSLSQQDLAKAIGRSQVTISDIEAGRRDGSPATLRLICARLGLELNDIFRDVPLPGAADGDGAASSHTSEDAA